MDSARRKFDIMSCTDTPVPERPMQLAPFRALIVDDSTPMRVFVRKLLEVSGASHIDCADCGSDALAAAAQDQYDILLVDIQMPDLDGHEVTRRLRERGLSTPIVAVTAHSAQEERERCLQSGFDACLIKPFSHAALVHVVGTVLAASRQQLGDQPRRSAPTAVLRADQLMCRD